jgi:hypothetical protein
MSHCPTRATLHELPGRSVLSWPGPASRIVASLVFTTASPVTGNMDSRRNQFQSPNHQLIHELTAPVLRAESTIYEHPICVDCEPERSAAFYTPPFPTNSIRDTASFYPMVCVLIERVHFGDLPSEVLSLSYPYEHLVTMTVCI